MRATGNLLKVLGIAAYAAAVIVLVTVISGCGGAKTDWYVPLAGGYRLVSQRSGDVLLVRIAADGVKTEALSRNVVAFKYSDASFAVKLTSDTADGGDGISFAFYDGASGELSEVFETQDELDARIAAAGAAGLSDWIPVSPVPSQAVYNK